jgi:hypothetical protein
MSSVRAIFLLLEVEIDDTAQTRQFALPRVAISSKCPNFRPGAETPGEGQSPLKRRKSKSFFFKSVLTSGCLPTPVLLVPRG